MPCALDKATRCWLGSAMRRALVAKLRTPWRNMVGGILRGAVGGVFLVKRGFGYEAETAGRRTLVLIHSEK